VHSVFQSALNLRPAGANELLTLVIASEADLPQGIRVNTPTEFSFERFNIGDPVTCQDDNLRIDSLTVGLHNAQRWKCDLSKLEFDSTKPTVSSAWGLVWDMLNERQRLSGSEIIAEALFRPNESAYHGVPFKGGAAMQALVNTTRRLNSTDASAVNSLIGLGSGLTPSGDDFLIGYVAGLWCTIGHGSERMQFIASLGKTIIQLLPKTNDISRTYLYHATQGQVSSRLANLAEGICHGESPAYLTQVAEAAMQVGHTSGMDALTGLLVGLTTWSNPGLVQTLKS
jgi:hypothetical protein